MTKPITEIENVRDLLAVAIAPELGKWFAAQPPWGERTAEIILADTQNLVAVVLDMMTAKACRDLAAFKEGGGLPRDPCVQVEQVGETPRPKFDA